jgi:branched-chain amino acid transport system permease protein
MRTWLRPLIGHPVFGLVLLGHVLLGLVLLAGCGSLIDADQARVCRTTLLALNSDVALIRVTRVTPGPRPMSLRVDYRVEEPGRPPRTRFVVCLFAGQGLAADKALLTGLATERGPLADATFYFLKRFYLEAPGEPPVDPAAGDRAVDAPEIPHLLAYGLQQAIGAVPLSAIYGLLAAAYALVFGLVGRINLAFGEFAALGGTAAVLGITATLAVGATDPAVGLVAGLVVAVFASALHGFVASRLAVAPIRSASGQPVIIATIGLALAMSEYMRLTQGSNGRWLPPLWNEALPLARADNFIVTVTPMALAVAGFALTIGAGLVAAMKFTRFGRAWRAFADDPLAAALFGVDDRRLLDATFALACGIAGLAGFVMVSYYGGMGFAAGFGLGLKALVAAVLGGIGSVAGAFIGGIAIGLAEALWSATLPIEVRDIAIYSLLVVILVFRPGGLLGLADTTPRRV